MLPEFTKSSPLAKINEEDLLIFQKVVELKFNERTKLNRFFDNDFKLEKDQYQMYQPYLFDVLNKLEEKYFVKLLLTDLFNLSVLKLKKKVILKGHIDSKLVLEISMSSSQLDAICEKYHLDLDEDINEKNSFLIYAGTFIKNENGVLTSKLTDLRLLKIAYR